MAIALHDLLQPQFILDVVSRITKGQGHLSRHFGFSTSAYSQERGELVSRVGTEVPVRHGTYRIQDRTRTVAKARAPGTGPATWQPQPIGEVAYTLCRVHEKIPLLAEDLMNLSRVVGPSSTLDPAGQDYVQRQLGFLVTRFNNIVELMAAGMIRGQFYLKAQGEDWIPTLTAPSATTGSITVDYQIPAGNKNQLNMLGAGNIITTSWANPAADILGNLAAIQQASAQLSGYAFTDVLVDPVVWNYVIANTGVQSAAGTANAAFEYYAFDPPSGGGHQDVAFKARLRGYPMLTWHIISEYLVTDGGTDPSYAAGTGTLTPTIPANTAVFMPPPDAEWVDLMKYSEHVSEKPGQPMVKRPSPYFWAEWGTQPTVVDLIGLMNCLPRLRIPKAIAPATVVF